MNQQARRSLRDIQLVEVRWEAEVLKSLAMPGNYHSQYLMCSLFDEA